MTIDIHSHLLTSDYLILFALFNFICFCSLLKFRNLEYKVGLTFWPCLSNFALTFQPEPFGSAPKRPEDLHSELAETTVSATLCLQSYCANVATEKQSGCKVSPVLTVISKHLLDSTELAFWWILSNTWLIQKSSACSFVLLQALCQRSSGLNVLLHIARPMNTCKETWRKPSRTKL